MNELEKWKERKVSGAYDGIDDCYHYYRKGFDTAIALDLPVKFAEWLTTINYSQLEFFTINGFLKPYKELYQYWINNIYKPDH